MSPPAASSPVVAPDGPSGAPVTPSPWMTEFIGREIAAAASTAKDAAAVELAAAYLGLHEHFVRFRVRAGRAGGRPFPISPIGPSTPPYIRTRFHMLRRFFGGLAGHLDDTEFDVYLGDGFERWSVPMRRPVFCFSKDATGDPAALILPDPLSLLRLDEFRADVEEGCRRYPWRDKVDVAFWRGSTTGDHYSVDPPYRNARLRLVDMASRCPHLVDARFTGYHPGCRRPVRDMIEARGLFGETVGIAEHMRYKYLLMLDGYTSPWPRFTWAMFGSSAIFKQCSNLAGWFDAGVTAGTHFVAIATDLSDLAENVRWARQRDDEIAAVAGQAQAFARQELTAEKMHAYVAALINAYTGAFVA